MSLSPATADMSVKGSMSGSATPLLQQVSQGLTPGLSSRRGSPLSLGDGFGSLPIARSVPATPLPGMPSSASHLSKAPGTPLTGDAPGGVNGILTRQNSPQTELNPSLSRMSSSGPYEGAPLTFNTIQSGVDESLQVCDVAWYGRRQYADTACESP